MNIEEEVKRIISQYNSDTWYNIDLSKELKDYYIAEEYKDNFCTRVCRKFSFDNSKCTKLNNELFESIKKGSDIFDLINE